MVRVVWFCVFFKVMGKASAHSHYPELLVFILRNGHGGTRTRTMALELLQQAGQFGLWCNPSDGIFLWHDLECASWGNLSLYCREHDVYIFECCTRAGQPLSAQVELRDLRVDRGVYAPFLPDRVVQLHFRARSLPENHPCGTVQQWHPPNNNFSQKDLLRMLPSTGEYFTACLESETDLSRYTAVQTIAPYTVYLGSRQPEIFTYIPDDDTVKGRRVLKHFGSNVGPCTLDMCLWKSCHQGGTTAKKRCFHERSLPRWSEYTLLVDRQCLLQWSTEATDPLSIGNGKLIFGDSKPYKLSLLPVVNKADGMVRLPLHPRIRIDTYPVVLEHFILAKATPGYLKFLKRVCLV